MSAPFRVRQILNLYPLHYRMAFASSGISIQHLQQYALSKIPLIGAVYLPFSRRYWVSTFRIIDPMNDLDAPWTTVVDPDLAGRYYSSVSRHGGIRRPAT